MQRLCYSDKISMVLDLNWLDMIYGNSGEAVGIDSLNTESVHRMASIAKINKYPSLISLQDEDKTIFFDLEKMSFLFIILYATRVIQ